MNIGDLCAGAMCGIGLAARFSELGFSVPATVAAGFTFGSVFTLLIAAVDERFERDERRKRNAERKCRRDDEYLPPGIVRVDGRLTYARTLEPRGSFKRCGDKLIDEAHAERKPPIRKLKLCDPLSRDFAKLPDEERREFFEGCI